MTGGIVDQHPGGPYCQPAMVRDAMNVDDTGSTTAKTGTLTATSSDRHEYGTARVRPSYSGLATLNISLGSGGTTGNTFNIAVAVITNRARPT